MLTSAVLLAWRSWAAVAGPARLLVLLGTVSYGAHLWNDPPALWRRPSLGAGAGPVAVALTPVMAAPSWRLVEARAPRRRRLSTVAA